MNIFFPTVSIAPKISLSAISSIQLHINLTAPNGSSSLTYKCTITEIDMPPKTVTGTELEYTVQDLRPSIYTVECISSNRVDSCDSGMDKIRRKLRSLIIYQIAYIYT